jgi:hypothetical protein
MTTSEPPSNGGSQSHDHEWMLFAEVSHANLSASPVSNAARRTNVGVGRGWSQSYAEYDPGSCWWRTLQRSFEIPKLGDQSSVDFTDSGSMQNGQLFPRAQWVRHTCDAACSLWPTPVARDWKGYTFRDGESICNPLREIYGRSGRPNPTWIAWIMGFPCDWCEIQSKPTETLLSPKLPNTLAG